MEFKFKFLLTQKANSDLDDIIKYISIELANPTAATDFIVKLRASIEEIQAFPESGAILDNDFLPNLNIRKKSLEITLCTTCLILKKKQFEF